MTHVIGTAGHVDHGKSSLVQALTGIDPDRLAEEKAREMTIDLGFAWLTLPNGESVGIVDVPGHRDFIENMLAGIGGIDLALFVIAADEGIMPQTREHLAILDLLQIPDGIIALTKIDMISDPDWLDILRADIATFALGSPLESAPVIPVSARSGDGLDQLITALQTKLEICPPRPDIGKPRLPVDRVFSMSGFGTVVTGTLIGGAVSVGDELEIAPSGLRTRVRGLQSHQQVVQTVGPGSRAAINLVGLSKEEIRRGDVVTLPGLLAGTLLIDVQFRHHHASGRTLRHDDFVKFFSGAAETIARVRLLADRELGPGADGWLQLVLDTPLALDKGDRFILRWPSPGETIGGGAVLDAHPEHRWRRFRPEVLARFETLSKGRPEDLLLDAIQREAAAIQDDIKAASGLDAGEFEAALQNLIANGEVIEAEGGWLVARTRWEWLAAGIGQELAAYHSAHPLKAGMPKEALRSRLGIAGRAFTPLAAEAARQGLVIDDGARVRLPTHTVRFSEAQEKAVQRLEALITSAPTTTPSIKEAAEITGPEVLQALFDEGRLTQINTEVLFGAETYQGMVEEVGAFIGQNGSITLAQARDLFHTSRKYATALLEHLDEIGVTRRVGDMRVLNRAKK